MPNWINACATGDIDEEDLIRFDHGSQTFAVFIRPKAISLPPPANAPMKRCICATGW